jgi:hypothetical protein
LKFEDFCRSSQMPKNQDSLPLWPLAKSFARPVLMLRNPILAYDNREWLARQPTALGERVHPLPGGRKDRLEFGMWRDASGGSATRRVFHLDGNALILTLLVVPSVQVLQMPSAPVIQVVKNFHTIKTTERIENSSPSSVEPTSPAHKQKIARHYAGMVSTYTKLGRRGIVSKQAVRNAVEMAAVNHPVLIIGKDITVEDAKGESTWWNDKAGPGPKLYRWATDWARGDGSVPRDPFSPHGSSGLDYGSFVDFWSVVLVHLDVIIGKSYENA